MKLAVVIFTLFALISVSVGDDLFGTYAKIKKWRKMKAMESCYGKDAMKVFHIKHKKALKKCSGMPVPELEMFQMFKPHRMVAAMLMNGKQMQQEKIMKMVMSMKAKEEKVQPAPQTMAFIPYPMMANQQQPHHEDDEHKMMMKMMKKMMMKKMMKKMMKGHMMDDDDDDNMDEDSGFFRAMDEDEEESFPVEEILKEIFKAANKERRSRRAAGDDGLFDLGEELTDKLNQQMEKFKAKMTNMSCVLQEFGMIDKNNNVDLSANLKELEDYNLQDEWLVEKNKKAIRLCYATVESLPREVLKECMDEKWLKIKMFHKCMEMKKTKACMEYDVKNMLEENFGAIEKIEEDTGLEEKMLLPLTKALLDDSFEM